ncbi:MAG TPA: endonuclease III [Candidatus Gracilibacteria bacterium]
MPNIDPAIFADRLEAHYASEICHLDWDKARPYTLLFAVILSAQCTDIRVNKTTPQLWKAFPDLESFVAQPVEHLESIVKPCGYYRAKSRNLKKCAEQLLLFHDGQVPNTMGALTSLAGVGRKTANVILWNVHQKNIGFVVDTHVGRIAQRVGLTQKKNPITIEQDLIKKLPQAKWGKMSHQLVQFGRDYCKAPAPKCSECFFRDVCPRKGVKPSK